MPCAILTSWLWMRRPAMAVESLRSPCCWPACHGNAPGGVTAAGQLPGGTEQPRPAGKREGPARWTATALRVRHVVIHEVSRPRAWEGCGAGTGPTALIAWLVLIDTFPHCGECRAGGPLAVRGGGAGGRFRVYVPGFRSGRGRAA